MQEVTVRSQQLKKKKKTSSKPMLLIIKMAKARCLGNRAVEDASRGQLLSGPLTKHRNKTPLQPQHFSIFMNFVPNKKESGKIGPPGLQLGPQAYTPVSSLILSNWLSNPLIILKGRLVSLFLFHINVSWLLFCHAYLKQRSNFNNLTILLFRVEIQAKSKRPKSFPLLFSLGELATHRKKKMSANPSGKLVFSSG